MYESVHTCVSMCIYYVGMYTYVSPENPIPFSQTVSQGICAFVVAVTSCKCSSKTFPVCLPFRFHERRQFDVNGGIEVWDEECLNGPLVVELTRGWGLMTAPQMNIRCGSGRILIPSSARKGWTGGLADWKCSCYVCDYVVGSKSFRPDIQKPRQMENAVRDI